MSVLEFLVDIVDAQNKYMTMVSSGFRNETKLIRILDPLMEKYGMTYDEAKCAVKKKLPMQEYLRIIRRKEEDNGN